MASICSANTGFLLVLFILRSCREVTLCRQPALSAGVHGTMLGKRVKRGASKNTCDKTISAVSDE